MFPWLKILLEHSNRWTLCNPHQPSCDLRSSWEGREILAITALPFPTLCPQPIIFSVCSVVCPNFSETDGVFLNLTRFWLEGLFMVRNHFNQCCGSVTFWYGSGSVYANPYLWLTDPDSDPTPDPAPYPVIFVSDLQLQDNKMTKKINFLRFFAYYFLKLHVHHFSKIKVIKMSQNSRNQGFSYSFWLVMEGSRSGSG